MMYSYDCYECHKVAEIYTLTRPDIPASYCVKDWKIDEFMFCKAGMFYPIKDMQKEIGEEGDGYCKVYGENDVIFQLT